MSIRGPGPLGCGNTPSSSPDTGATSPLPYIPCVLKPCTVFCFPVGPRLVQEAGTELKGRWVHDSVIERYVFGLLQYERAAGAVPKCADSFLVP